MKSKRKSDFLKKDQGSKDMHDLLASAKTELNKLDFLLYKFSIADQNNFYSYFSRISK